MIGAIGEELALRRMDPVDGWFSPVEARTLYRSVLDGLRKFPSGAVVEIGSYRGRSTVVLATALEAVGSTMKVDAIDPHMGVLTGIRTDCTWDDFSLNIEKSGVSKWVNPIRKSSCEVPWAVPIGTLFVDGLHDADSVAADYEHFARFVPAGGTIAFHDYSNPDYPGVRSFVDGKIRCGELLAVTMPTGEDPLNTLAVTRKRAKLSIIIPTCGRESLLETLESIAAAGAVLFDDVIVVGDGPQPRSLEIVNGFRPLGIRYLEYGPTRMVGAAQRNFAIGRAVGSHVMFSDDDDRSTPGAIELVRKTAEENPGRVLLFKEESCVERHNWGIIWKTKEIVEGNVGTQMVVAPAVQERLGKFGSHYCGDYDFIRETVDLYPGKDGSVIWVDSIISQLY